ncbi:MAG TPA: ribosomal L7Ae/L30e/S12e/Gadd45 family protein [Gemmatimonadales bacterium]|nr:ribosomal L7Ae/L30e/S12e/Gadd45 family protein [Gemmatimonadales bacterium]
MSRLQGLLGLGMRARSVVVGVAGVRARLRSGSVRCVVLAADASARTRDKVERLAVARGVPVVRGPEAAALGAGLGRPPVQAVGVEDGALARGVVEATGGRP